MLRNNRTKQNSPADKVISSLDGSTSWGRVCRKWKEGRTFSSTLILVFCLNFHCTTNFHCIHYLFAGFQIKHYLNFRILSESYSIYSWDISRFNSQCLRTCFRSSLLSGSDSIQMSTEIHKRTLFWSSCKTTIRSCSNWIIFTIHNFKPFSTLIFCYRASTSDV